MNGSRQGYWIILGAWWIIGFALGISGFQTYSQLNGMQWQFSEILYRTIQLIVLESGAVGGRLNWMLESARYLLPALTGLTAVQALMLLFREQRMWIQIKSLRGHVVVCGYGHKGSSLARDLLANGYKVVVIDVNQTIFDPTDPAIAGIHFVPGDARDASILQKCNLQNASHLVCMVSQDQANLEIALTATKFLGSNRTQPLHCVIHLESTELLSLVKGIELDSDISRSLVVEVFNPYTHAARQIINEDDGWLTQQTSDIRVPSPILVIGLGRLGANIIQQVAYRCYRQKKTGKLTIYIFDSDANQKSQRLLQNHPHLEKVCRLIPTNVDLSQNFELESAIASISAEPPKRLYLCLSNPILSLQIVLSLQKNPIFQLVPIQLRIGNEINLLNILCKTGQIKPPQLIPFEMINRTCSAELVVGGLEEALAQGLYYNYLTGKGINQIDKPWLGISEAEKQENRAQARRITALLGKFNFQLRALVNWDAADFTFVEKDLLQMAIVEHDKWRINKQNAGWTYAAQTNPKQKQHRDLVSWQDLPHIERQKNIQFVRELPLLLADLGFQIEIKE